MCGGPEQSNGSSVPPCQGGGCRGSGSELDGKSENEDFNDMMSYLLELAANNDLDGFKRAVEEDGAKVDAVGMWYSRQSGTTQMVLEQRTPAMIAALYGSLDVLKYILDVYAICGGDINQSSETDGSTALHCAAAGGSVCALDTAKLILDFGADLNVCDLQGRRPADVVAKFTRLTHVKAALEKILTSENGMLMSSDDGKEGQNALSTGPVVDGDVLQMNLLSSSSTSSLLRGSGHSPFSSPSPSSSPKSVDTMAGRTFGENSEKVKEYPVDPSIPDIKSSIYATDEFRMFSFKVRPCSRAYSHDWTECPFVHPGENARRRDPRRYHYSCVPCPDFRKGACRRGDACEYAHGVFECWLHPAQYRTRLCKDGTACTRRVCFFAHTTEELRPLYVSTGSAVPSPRGTSSLDMAAMSPPLAPGSPSSMLMMSPLQSSNPTHTGAHGSFATPPMSPSSASSLTGTWSPNNVPTLHLPGVSLHASRLRAELNARDLSLEDLESATDYDGQLNDFTSLSSQALSTQARLNAAIAASSCGMSSSRVGKYRSLGLSVAPTNLEEMFASEVLSSPKSMLHDSALLSPMETQLQAYKSRLHCQLQNELHSQSGPQAFSPMADLHLQLQQAALDSQLQVSNLVHSPRQGSSFSLGSLARMSARGGVDIDSSSSGPAGLSPSLIAARAAAFARDKRSHSSRDLGAGFSISDWGSPTGTPEWGVHGDDLSKFKKSASFGFRQSDEPDLSWVQRLVKDGSQDLEATAASVSEDGGGNMKRDASDLSVLGTWVENMHLDQIVA